MGKVAEALTLRIPRSVVAELPTFPPALNERMHAMLERNTEGTLGPIEMAELETLVQMAQFAHILAMIAEGQPPTA